MRGISSNICKKRRRGSKRVKWGYFSGLFSKMKELKSWLKRQNCRELQYVERQSFLAFIGAELGSKCGEIVWESPNNKGSKIFANISRTFQPIPMVLFSNT